MRAASAHALHAGNGVAPHNYHENRYDERACLEVAKMTTDSSAARFGTYWLTRFVLLRLLGCVYAVAFLAAARQIIPLIGAHGLLPLDSFFIEVQTALGSKTAGFLRIPSLFWLAHSDATLVIVAWLGVALSCVVICGYANAIMMAVLWLLYMSFVHVGQDWYGYGWEIQLLETGFLAIFLCPLLDARPFSPRTPPLVVIWLFRWLIFRIMLGAGLIKLRGDDAWRDLTALYYQFETQPIPNPLSRWFHFLPHWILKVGVAFNHLAELIAPVLVFHPRRARHIAGMIIIAFQSILIMSGNLSFLNWLTIVPALACFDDGFWSKVLPRAFVTRMTAVSARSVVPNRVTKWTRWSLVAVIGVLSMQPIANMLSPRQIMNTSFNPLDIVNTYGAFGTVGRERLNIVFEGTNGDPNDANTKWVEYPYRALPVDIDKRPVQIAPYQPRLDWQMWFAAMSTPDQYPWTLHLVWKLLHNDPGAIGLFAANPFPQAPPRHIRAVSYRYRFAPSSQPHWWTRERLGLWLPALSVDDPRLRDALQQLGWRDDD